MKIYKRALSDILNELKGFPAIAILGPRQSGKTTFAQANFKNHAYVSFEDPSVRQFAKEDPRGFLTQYKNKHGIVIDEFQYVPNILSYLQLEIDEHQIKNYFILTGSQNYLMNQHISQSLAGRIAIINLLPLSIQELEINKLLNSSLHEAIIQGSYPRIFSAPIAPSRFYPSYINTYVERDVRQLINVGDLSTFQKFLGLCAGRVGQLINLSDLAVNCGISVPTAKKWLSILEASYIIFQLQPYFNNYNKRLTKSPKLYFYDTGLLCNILGIASSDILEKSPFRGNIFENFIIADFIKQECNLGKRPRIYFWRDTNGRIEVDGIFEHATQLYPIEIKASQTVQSSYFKNISAWETLAGIKPGNGYVVYAGMKKQHRTAGTFIGWKDAGTLLIDLYKKE